MDIRENRALERYDLQVPVTINSLESDARYSAIETRDISSGGVFIQSRDIDLSPGSKVQVEMTLTVEKLKELFQVSSKILLKVDGQVTRTTSNGIAVKFSSNYKITPVAAE